MKKLILAISFLLFLTSLVFSQEKEEILGELSIKTSDGFLFIDNNKEESYSFEINGKNVKAATESSVPLFIVDGNPIQVLSVPLTNFAPKDKKLSNVKLLEAHKIWESNYLGKEIYKKKLEIQSKKIKIGERDNLFWSFVRPIHNNDYKSDHFMTTIIGSKLLVLVTSITENEKAADAKKSLTDIIKTLKTSDNPFDVKKIAASFRKS